MSTLAYTFAVETPLVEAPEPAAWKLADDPGLKPGELRRYKTAYFVANFWRENRYGPTLREIQNELSIKSLTTIRSDLDFLSEQGMVTYNPTQARTLVPTDRLLAQT